MDNVDWKDLLFGFEGRINRAKYWAGYAVSFVFALIAWILWAVIGGTIGVLLLVLAYIGLVWIGLAVSIKRWHDRGKSGWWILIVFVPIIGGLWALIETGFLAGDTGDNEYGSDPLAA